MKVDNREVLHGNLQKTQVGTLVIATGVFALVVILWAIPRELVEQRIILGLVAILAVSLFYSLTIVITPEHLKFSLGIGVIRKTIPLSDIVSCTPVRISIFTGWGIKKIPGGWQYNVTGLDAVDIYLRNGKLIRIGTPEPREVCKTIEELRKSTL